ncbi:MAG: hypothetical protein JRJ19_03305 [Deltaproteobacteria bacterium]|nr:hypothetical protein [Deltaproteobacteria bacterium]
MEVKLPAIEKETKIDYLYTIQAQVTDLSRRTIQGKGQVKVTRDPFFIFSHTRQGFFSPKDKIEIEVEAMTPQDKPVQAIGNWTVYRMTYPIGEKEKEEKLTSRPVKTDTAGRAFIHWSTDEIGHYRIKFELKKGNGRLVEHKHDLFVTSDKFDPGRFKFQKVTLKTDKRTYLRGETIRLMLGAPKTNSVVWYSEEGGDEIFKEKVIRLDGSGTIIEIPADETRAPNFFVRVVMLADGQVYTAQQHPGKKGKLKIEVKDHQGKPVKGQLCLSVFDSAVLYIQGDTTGDIRPYFYGERRYLNLWVNNSLQIYQMLEHWSPRRPRFKPGGLPYAGLNWSAYSNNRWGLDQTGSLGYYGYGRGGGGGLGRGNIAINGEASRFTYRSVVADASVAQTGVIGLLSRSESGGEDFDRRGRDSTVVRGPAGGKSSGAAFAPVKVRESFADTALWLSDVETDEKGQATIEVDYPDSTTTWQGRLFVVDKGRKVGMAKTTVITTKKLVARIETPRFLTEGDKLKLAAVIHNGFDHPLDVQVRLALSGIEFDSSPELRLTIPANSDMRHDFSVIAKQPGTAVVKLFALSKEESDALQKTLTVYEWGSDKMVTAADTLKKAGTIELSLDLPKQRRKGSARLTIEAAPSMGGVLLRALPYLIRYPYGCIEQTISRFVPAAVVAHTLKQAGISLEQLKPVRGKATIAKHLGKLPWYASIRSSKELDRIIRLNIKRIASMQNPDGGFGWFSGFDSSIYMTAYVIIGLHEAKLAGYNVDSNILERAVTCLHGRTEDLGPNHLGVFVAYAVGLENRPMPKLLKRAYRRRDKLSPYGQSLLALGLVQARLKSKARMVVENLADLAWVDKANQTATFKPPPSRWWLWWFNRVETTAWALRAFLKIDPKHAHVDRLAKWLVRNRSGNRWTSTKDTSMAILALTDYMRARGELNPNGNIEIFVNDRKIKSFKVTRRTVLGLDGTVVLDDKALAADKVEVKIKLSGRGVVYGSVFLEYFTKEKKIKGEGYEIEVSRSYKKLTPKTVLRKRGLEKTKVREYDSVPIKEGQRIASGDLVEVRLEIKSMNDYSFLVFEDFKPAGFEPLELKSGCRYENGTWQYRELRDERVVHFLQSLPQGSQVLTYRMRAEIPGTFRVRPHKAQAMYAPRIRAISDSFGIQVTE